MGSRALAQVETTDAFVKVDPSARKRGAAKPGETRGRNWLTEPKTAVWFALGAVVLVGGGRKVSLWWQARKAIARIQEPNAVPEDIEAVAEFGRAGVYELLRIFSSTAAEPERHAAGRALARLWRLDQLVAEEEQAIVRRGYEVTWGARRRYPRALRAEIPITVRYEIPFLEDGDRLVGPANLECSHRLLGSRRAGLEEFSPWTAGRGHASFTIFPGDFDTNGPHRLVLQTRIRTAGLTDAWQIEPPHVPFNFEFDPALRLDAIMTLADATRDQSVAAAITLESGGPSESGSPNYLALGGEWTVREPPRLAVRTPLPCDLAHTIALEIEGIEGQYPAGSVVLWGQGLPGKPDADAEGVVQRFALGPVPPLPSGAIARAGRMRLRAWLSANPDLGWADPQIRSVWPGQVATNWVDVEIMRR
jgi:hypothetical protein